MTTTDVRPMPSVLSVVDVRRLENDAIRKQALGFDRARSAEIGFTCECGDLRCRRIVWRSLAQYDASPPGTVKDH
jgi:hypothetical protein